MKSVEDLRTTLENRAGPLEYDETLMAGVRSGAKRLRRRRRAARCVAAAVAAIVCASVLPLGNSIGGRVVTEVFGPDEQMPVRPPASRSVASLTVAPAAAMPSKPSTTGTGRPASGVPSTRYWTWTPEPLDFIGAVVIALPAGPAAPAASGRASARAQARAAAILTGC